MFKKRTLFIVGAGASAEFDLPVGTQLAATIANKMDVRVKQSRDLEPTGDHDIFHQLMHFHQSEIREYQQAMWVIRDGVQMSSSIDDFLDVRGADERIKTAGKMAIVKSVLEAERRSKLFFNKSNIYNRMKVEKFENTWIVKFVRMLGRGVPKERAGEVFSNVAFIVFNYDRCIEHCSLHALQQLYSIGEAEAASILEKLTILHPYGQAGSLKTAKEHGGIAYGGEPDKLSAPYYQLAKEIKTYTEQVGDPGELKPIHDEMHAAERVVFLGFAFHDQNMALLKPESLLSRKDIYATAYGMSSNDVQVVNNQLLTFFAERKERPAMSNGHIHIRADLKCADMFDQYTKSFPA